LSSIQGFLDSVESQGGFLFAKRLAANDTLATGAHQAGFYIPKGVAFELFPSLEKSSDINPKAEFHAEIVSHAQGPRVVHATWYNQKTRDECHITGWGGASSPVLDPESTGSLCLFGFFTPNGQNVEHCSVWLCSNPEEEDEFERRFDIVEPGNPAFLDFTSNSQIRRQDEFEYNLPTEKLELWDGSHDGAEFPTGKELIDFVVQKYADTAKLPVDERLVRRRDLEYIEFRRLEKTVVLPRVKDGFVGVDQFVDYANSVTNRRKSRSGKSLELHFVRILEEEGIQDFAHDKVTEGNKRPDFIFPSIAAYQNSEFPSDNLRMLACKTTCKDRWRQVIDEAPRIPVKHLLTLQQGVSENQFAQMKEAGIRLVVPRGLHKKFPKSVRSELLTIEDFIAEVRGPAD
jgi:restriction endonuclease EcoRII-like protein